MDADTLRLVLIVTGSLLLLGLYLWERWRARIKEEARRGSERPEAGSEPRLGAWHEGDTDAAEVLKAARDGARGGVAPAPIGRGGPGRPTGTPAFATSSPPPAVEAAGKPVSKPGSDGPARHATAPDGASPGKARDTGAPADPGAPLILSLHITPKAGAFRGEDIVRAASKCGIEPGEMDIFHRYRDPASPRNPLFSVANMVKPGTFPFGAMADFESPGLTLFAQIGGAADDSPRLEDMFLTAHCLAGELAAEIRDDTRGPLTPEVEQRLRDRVLELVTYRLSKRVRK